MSSNGTGQKNKCAPPFRTAEFDIRWGSGIDRATDLLDRAVDLGVVDKKGAHLSFGGEALGQGRERAREAILATEKLAGALRSAIEAASLGVPIVPELPSEAVVASGDAESAKGSRSGRGADKAARRANGVAAA